jgi:hypothetical protein
MSCATPGCPQDVQDSSKAGAFWAFIHHGEGSSPTLRRVSRKGKSQPRDSEKLHPGIHCCPDKRLIVGGQRQLQPHRQFQESCIVASQIVCLGQVGRLENR